LNVAITWCLNSKDEETLEELSDFLESSSRVFGDAQCEMLIELFKSLWAQEEFAEAIRSAVIETKVVELLMTFAMEKLQEIMDYLEKSETEHLGRFTLGKLAASLYHLTRTGQMLNFLTAPGCPAFEDELSPRAVEFWSAFTEEAETLDPDNFRFPVVQEYVAEAATRIWSKVRIPSDFDWDTSGEDTKKEFTEFRNQAKDFFASSYLFLGPQVVKMFSEVPYTDPMTEDTWFRLESTIFCFLALDCVSDEENDALVSKVFQTPFLQQMASADDISKRIRRTAVSLVGTSAKFFSRNTMYLGQALTFLFANLHQSGAPDEAAQAIFRLCSSCRKMLTSDISAFFQQFDGFIQQPSVTEYAVDKISGALACLLQALPSMIDTLNGTRTLVNYVYSGINQAIIHVQAGDIEQGHLVARMALRCLASIARGLQSPVIDLDEVPVPVDESVPQQIAAFQADVFGIMANALQNFGNDREVIQEICNVFMSGFMETAPAPFHFAPGYVFNLFVSTNIMTPNLEAILGMICAFTRSQERNAGPVDPAIGLVLGHLLTLIQAKPDPREEPEVSQSIISVLVKCVPTYIDLLLHLEPADHVKTMFDFLIRAVEIPEPLPKREALSFWVSLSAIFTLINTSLASLFVPQSIYSVLSVHVQFGSLPVRTIFGIGFYPPSCW
jgi:hypothetical protein